ncbi:DUF3604 domain-containing protein [Nevskia soli]|uniref:DUF3604 domain-containing protein n=1 Tax=Nevskia soli TaxID=418856 RepID=UPI0015D95046|nr:DUF3604 domain-containing protein [Nevskia soli]
MRIRPFLLASFGSIVLLAVGLPAAAQNLTSVRILLGVGDTTPTRWDGTLQVAGGSMVSLDPWRFEGSDGISGATWHFSTHPVRLFSGTSPTSTAGNNIVANGVIATISTASSDAEIKITTAQGDFGFRLGELTYGKPVSRLEGKVHLDRIPVSTQITNTKEEEDFPAAAAGKNGEVWVAYIQFHHNPEHNALRAALDSPPKDFSKWKSPTGGDQVFMRKYANGKWGDPIPVTESGLDAFKTSIAVDGQGRPWVFWSQNARFPSRIPNFEIFARVMPGGQPGKRIQISNDPGNDVAPVAATDSKGNVWVAWQGWRNGKAAILAATQSGSEFGPAQIVSKAPANQWNPAIAADQKGRVTVAWDTYRNENYDIYMRTAVDGNWGPETPVAATARYEAYPSIAYENTGRLWIAYEEGGKGWGKDFGAYTTPGVAVYQGRAIRVRGFEPDGRVVQTVTDPGASLPGFPSIHFDKGGLQKDFEKLDPDPENAKTRKPDTGARNMQNARNNFPRLTVDSSGRIWLAVRSAHPVFWSPIGTVWTEFLISYDGKGWTNPIFLNHSDNLLDNKPALVSTQPGQLLVVNSSDKRRRYDLGEAINSPLGIMPTRKEDPYENDLYASTIDLGVASQPLAVADAPPVQVAGAEAVADKTDLAALKKIRDYTINTSAGDLKIVRGEFHRHSEISMDGGGDGSIIDQYRYALDAGSLDWVGCCDHDNGAGREYTWWLSQKLTDIFYSPGTFTPMFSYERSVNYPEGHRNVIFAQRGVRTLPRQPITEENQNVHAPDTQSLYAYLKAFNGIAAAHTSATGMGTDWRDNDPLAEPVVEIYQGDRQNYEMPDAPRSNSEKDSIGLWRPKGFVSLALAKGYKLGFQASSDHISTHMSYCNLLAKDTSRESLLDAFQKRHVYGATDNILADVRSGPHIMGDAFATAEQPNLHVKLSGTSKFSKVVVIKDNNYVYSTEPGTSQVEFSWRDNSPTKGKTSYYYVRGEQDTGDIVWASPMWITYTGK